MTSTHTRPFRGQAAPWRPTGQPGPADPECGGPFRLLYVCTGNMCRSVFAEVITRHALQERSARRAAWFHVSSAGTAASPGQAVHPYTVAALRRMGIQLDGYEARRLTPSLLRDSDLVLTATVAQRDWAVGLLPAGSRRTFAIREFARVCDTLAGTPGRDEPPLDAPPNPAEQARRVVSAAFR
ncbi:MAG TPA: hypothetical protein VJT31_38595, partial [Rugosimonospora sp.]|nr:hypothetical protein [Rugosimonospora sp.]